MTKGRPKKVIANFEVVYQNYKNGEISLATAAKFLGISINTFKQRVKEKEKETIL